MATARAHIQMDKKRYEKLKAYSRLKGFSDLSSFIRTNAYNALDRYEREFGEIVLDTNLSYGDNHSKSRAVRQGFSFMEFTISLLLAAVAMMATGAFFGIPFEKLFSQ